MDTQLVATQMIHRSWMEDYARQQERGLTVRQRSIHCHIAQSICDLLKTPENYWI